MVRWQLPSGLPPGRFVRPDEGDPEPVLWVSTAPVDDLPALWTRLFRARGATGLWPLALDGSHDDPDRPWLGGELWPVPVGEVDAAEPGEVFADRWDASATGLDGDDDVEALAPFAMWPGLAPPGIGLDTPDAVARRVAADLRPGRLGLVPAHRGADALAVCGWTGPSDYATTTQVAAMVRSWEERFGARVLRVGFDALRVAVAAPPLTDDHLLHVAAEHFAFCPDVVWRGSGSLREHAASLAGRPRWDFRWD